MKIEVHAARLLTFGGELVLKPGENQVDDQLFLSRYEKDAVMRAHYEEKSYSVRNDDGSEWRPEGGEVSGSKESKDHNEHAEIPTEGLKKPVERETEPQPKGDSEPTPVAGGVPGFAEPARAAVAICNDPNQLEAWLQSEDRTSVRRAIWKRQEELNDADADDNQEE